jgi:hypothetical protein
MQSEETADNLNLHVGYISLSFMCIDLFNATGGLMEFITAG